MFSIKPHVFFVRKMWFGLIWCIIRFLASFSDKRVWAEEIKLSTFHRKYSMKYNYGLRHTNFKTIRAPVVWFGLKFHRNSIRPGIQPDNFAIIHVISTHYTMLIHVIKTVSNYILHRLYNKWYYIICLL